MPDHPHHSTTREQRVNAAIASYLQAVDAGRPPDRAAFLAQHADVATELDAFLVDRDRFRRLAGDAPTIAPGDPAPHAALGTVRYFGDYELLEEIARGGMGVVFKARQVSLDRVVALKMILAGQLASPADVQRFRAEAKAAANLKHPNIVAIHEVGEHEGQRYFSMDYIAGRSLAQMVRENPLPAARAARYVQAIAEAIAYAHRQGTLHRDLKPSNVLIDETDRPHVTDFGLAKRLGSDAGMTLTGQVLGTPSYMPPEQAAGRPEQVGPVSDVYALGALLYELLTGRPPFRAESVFDTIMQVIHTEPVPPRLLNPKVPRELDTISLKCLEKDPQKRYAGAQELADDLGRFLAGEPIHARPPSVPFVVRQFFRQNLRATMWTVLVGLIAGLLMTVPTYFVWGGTGRPGPDGQMVITTGVYFKPLGGAIDFNKPPLLQAGMGLGLAVALANMLLLMVPGFFQGLLAGYLAAPANRAGDVAVGAASGLIAGLVFFVAALGPQLTADSLGRSQPDLTLLERAAATDSAKGADPIAEAYPDWSTLDRAQRSAALVRKIRTDMTANGTRALWAAVGLSLLAVPFGIVMALFSGQVARREGSLWSATKTALFRHDDTVHVLTVGAFLLCTVLLGILALLGFAPNKPWWLLLHTMPLFLAAWVEGRHRKLFHEFAWRRHRVLAAALLISCIVGLVRFVVELTDLLTGNDFPLKLRCPWPWYADALVYAVTVVLTIRYLVRERDPARR
jgi:hypothetical protein